MTDFVSTPVVMYKVVLYDGDTRYSFSSYGYLRVEYLLGIAVTAPVGKLFVFDTYKNAYEFMGQYRHEGSKNEIWRCEVTNPEKMAKIAATLGAIEWFWSVNHRETILQSLAPEGAYCVDTVKLLKQAWPEPEISSTGG